MPSADFGSQWRRLGVRFFPSLLVWYTVHSTQPFWIAAVLVGTAVLPTLGRAIKGYLPRWWGDVRCLRGQAPLEPVAQLDGQIGALGVVSVLIRR